LVFLQLPFSVLIVALPTPISLAISLRLSPSSCVFFAISACSGVRERCLEAAAQIYEQKARLG
jgi:hypothetical protein